jgi:Xaa-Pro aminopeptidase
MHRAAKVSLSLFVLLSFAASLSAIPKKEYFTEDELDLIRDAQELGQRVPVYFKLAERRLIFLGLMEKSEKEKEREQKEKEKREKEKKKAGDTRATANKVDPEDTSYLADFTSAELLRGYIEAIDEVTTNIDYAYSRKLDVRDQLEDLDKFTRETIPVLGKFKPKNNGERTAMEEAIDKAKEAQDQTKEALNAVPKTEKKRKQQ